MTDCLVILYPAWRQSVIAIYSLCIYVELVFFPYAVRAQYILGLSLLLFSYQKILPTNRRFPFFVVVAFVHFLFKNYICLYLGPLFPLAPLFL